MLGAHFTKKPFLLGLQGWIKNSEGGGGRVRRHSLYKAKQRLKERLKKNDSKKDQLELFQLQYFLWDTNIYYRNKGGNIFCPKFCPFIIHVFKKYHIICLKTIAYHNANAIHCFLIHKQHFTIRTAYLTPLVYPVYCCKIQYTFEKLFNQNLLYIKYFYYIIPIPHGLIARIKKF